MLPSTSRSTDTDRWPEIACTAMVNDHFAEGTFGRSPGAAGEFWQDAGHPYSTTADKKVSF
jgi:hypothetical protein